jgi:hypothetical protein
MPAATARFTPVIVINLLTAGDDHPRHKQRQHPRYAHAIGGRLDDHLITCQQALSKSLERGARHACADVCPADKIGACARHICQSAGSLNKRYMSPMAFEMHRV